MSFLSYTQKFVSNHDYISHVLGFWKNIYVILKLIAACLQKTLEKTLRKCRSCTACHPGASENMHVQLIWRQFAPGWEFKPGQDREAEFTQGQFFFSFLVVNTGIGLTTHRAEFNPGRNSPLSEILVVNRPIVYIYSLGKKFYCTYLKTTREHEMILSYAKPFKEKMRKQLVKYGKKTMWAIFQLFQSMMWKQRKNTDLFCWYKSTQQ